MGANKSNEKFYSKIPTKSGQKNTRKQCSNDGGKNAHLLNERMRKLLARAHLEQLIAIHERMHFCFRLCASVYDACAHTHAYGHCTCLWYNLWCPCVQFAIALNGKR